MAKTQETLILSLIGLISLSFFSQINASFPYYGTKIGSLKRLHHGVSGDVYAVDSRTVFVKNFNYDGEAPAAYFYVGNTNKPSNDGAHRLRDERGSTTALTRRYRNKDITLSLPEGKTLRDIKWFSVWCDEFAVNFGDVAIPNDLDFPRPQKISALKGVHGVGSDNIVIVDAQTLLVPNFSYDGEAPDAKFWVGRGQHPTPQGLRIPDENGKEIPLRRYDRKTIVLTLPADLTIFDIGHFGVWCEAFTVDFGHVRIPEGLNVPPSLKMLGISPQSKLNCEVLYDDLAFEVRWAVAGESIVIQLVAKLANNEYMSFGISPSKNRSVMIGSDVVVAWVERDTGKGFAVDYYLDDKSQCSGSHGTCPDVNVEENTNSIRLLNAAMVNGYSIVTYQRSLQATDKLDLPISVNGTEAIVWAIGPLNERKEASFHTQWAKRTHYVEFGRQPTWNCPMAEGSKASSSASDENDEEEVERNTSVDGYPPAKSGSSTPANNAEPEEEFYDNRAQALQRPNRRPESHSGALSNRPVPTPKPANTNGAWDIPAIQCHEPEDGVFYAQMGPTGGKHGYPAITGHVGWGISWYINGLLIPEIHLVRGKTYTFVVEGGNNPDIPAKYHPFYITDDPVGGYEHKREEEKKDIRIFAGVHRSRSGQVAPTGVGRLCNWTPDIDGPSADDYQSFGAYQRTLTLKCDPGEPGVITWKPDRNTPDTVYYHCFTHRYLGWKIHVHDSCDDPRFAASEKHEVRVPANFAEEELVADSSIRHETKVSPNDNFLLKHQTDLIKNHNMNGTPPKLTFEITKSSEITKLISDGIRAAEALEESILRNGNNNNNNNQVATPGLTPPIGQQQYNNKQQHPLNMNPTVVNNLRQQQQTLGTGAGQIPLKPVISTAAPEILHGETSIQQHTYHQNPQSLQNIHTQSQSTPHSTSHILHHPHHLHYLHHMHHHNHPNNLTNLPAQSQKTIGLSEYLRPPQNAPLFHPVKIPGRRPYPGPLKKVPASKPVLPQQLPRHPPPSKSQLQLAASIPQPAVILNHYRKPYPGLLKPYFKEKPYPIQPIGASVLLLGQPTELGSGNQRKQDPSLLYSKTKPLIPVPYGDLVPQDTLQSNVYAFNGNIKMEKKPSAPAVNLFNNHVSDNNLKPESTSPENTPPAVFKTPFDMHEVKEEPSSLEIATMKPAVNLGFKPDSVVVESGFRPILRHNDTTPEADQVAHRREDPGSEIDEVMESDLNLFLAAQKETQTQHFEPMFIPSPPDSTNTTIIIRKVVPSPPAANRSPAAAQLISSDMPAAEKLRNSTLAELLEEVEAALEQQQQPEESSNDDLPVQQENEEDRKETENTNNKNEIENENIKLDEVIEVEKLPIDKKKVENGLDLDLLPDEMEEDDLEDDEDDKVAQAAERIDTYYLPPDNRKIPHASIPSGAVITYDGKSLIDESLVLPPKLESRDSSNLRRQNYGLSKIEQLIRTPQFRPFRGEIPPPVAEFLSTEKSKLSINPVTEFASNTYSPHSSYASSPSSSPSLSSLSSRPISTKLQILKSNTA